MTQERTGLSTDELPSEPPMDSSFEMAVDGQSYASLLPTLLSSKPQHNITLDTLKTLSISSSAISSDRSFSQSRRDSIGQHVLSSFNDEEALSPTANPDKIFNSPRKMSSTRSPSTRVSGRSALDTADEEIHHSTEAFFSEDLLSPVTHFSDRSTASESSFYDYLLANQANTTSHIRRELFETFTAAGTGEALRTESLRNAVPGYALLSNISSDLYRGFNRQTKRSVLVKFVSYVSAGSITRFFNEWYTLSGLNCGGPNGETPDPSRPRTLPTDIEGVLYPVDFVPLKSNGGYALVYNDVLNLKSFNEVFVMGRVKDKGRILTAFISCVETLKKVHSHRVTHNGLTSSNIFINDNYEVYISGWDFSFSYHTEDCTRGYRTLNKRYLIDWLPYMAPEVSGETNSFADHRADFYSIGVIMYQIFASVLPFIASDARELINKHIKEEPRPLSDFGLDGPLNDMVMKLLHKRAYFRYPSCDFLLDDLKYVLTLEPTQWEDAQDRELSLAFMPRGLYGREVEISYLESLYESVGSGVHLLLIQGKAGAGKTRLVTELQSRIVSGNHFFAQWKCNSKTTGLAAFISILNNILHQITASSEDDILSARDSIIKIVGSSDLSPLFVHLPELKDVLGPNYSKIIQHEKIATSDFLVRPESDFRRLLKCLFIALGEKYPLTVFLDDFQWFSLVDIELLNDIRTDVLKEELKSSIIILATFDSSDADHLEEFKKRLNFDYLEMEVGMARPQKFQSFTKDMFAPDISNMSIQTDYPRFFTTPPGLLDDIAETFHDKIGGNTLMAVHLLDQALLDSSISFGKQPAGLSQWVLDREKFDALPSDYKGVYNLRIATTFNEDDQELLKFAACIYENTMFSLDDLVVATQRPIQEVYMLLCRAMETYMIRPMNIFYKFPFHLGPSDLPFDIDEIDLRDMSSLCLFSLGHDTLYTYISRTLMNEDELVQFHKIIGMRFYQCRQNVENDAVACMEIANHFAKSYTAVSSTEDAVVYIKVLSLAQAFCYKTYDFIPALKFLNISKQLSEKHIPDLTPAKKFAIDYEITKCMLKTQNIQGVFDFIDDHGPEFREDPRIVLVYIQALSVDSRTEECLELTMRCLNKNNIPFDSKPETFSAQHDVLADKLPKSITEIRMIVREKGAPSSLQAILQEIIAEMVFVGMYRGDVALADLLGHYLVVDSLTNGASGFSAVGYIVLAIAHIRKSMTISKEFSQFALYLLKSTKAITLDFCNKVFYVYVFSVGVYLEPVNELLKFYETYSSNTSQLTSTLPINFILRCSIKPTLEILNGTNLQSVYNRLFRSIRKIDLESPVNRAWFNATVSLLRQFLKMPYDEKFDVLNDPEFDLEKSGFLFKCFYFSVMQWLNVSDISQGHSLHAKMIDEEILSIFSHVPYNLLTVFFIIRRTLDTVSDRYTPDNEKYKILSQHADFLRECKINSPTIFESKYLMHCAEMMKLEKCSDLEILDAYENAIEAALMSGIPVDAASSHEQCAKWLLYSAGSKKRAKKHFQEAARHFQQSGYLRRVSLLKQNYPDAFDNFQFEVSSTTSRKSSDMGSLSPIKYFITSVLGKESREISDLLDPDQENTDFFMALKATLSVSESLNTDSIIENLVKETVSIVRASYAIVALRSETGDICYKAVGGPSFFNHLEVEDSEKLLLPKLMMKECVETGSTLESTSEFNHHLTALLNADSYFIKSVPRSFVCLPIKNEVEILGALYLENSDVSKVFTKKKMKFTELLCTQAAFALDKARLYYRTMLAKKAAEEATAEKATFLANMSHEIRTPFNSLFACAGFLLDTSLDPLQREYVETVQSSAQVTLNIIDAILTFSKIEHGSIRLEAEWFSLNECIESAMQLIAEQASHKNLELAFFNTCGEADLIRGDQTRFKQIIINLLGNSVKFTQEGSVVVKSYARKMSTEGVYEFTISIQDTGIGIPKDSHSKVFGAFSQVDGSSRRVYGGSGLGLAISKKLVDLMGGTLQFESNEGEGTTFYLSLASSVRTVSTSWGLPGKSKILVIADESYSSLSLKEHIQMDSTCSVEMTSEFESLESVQDFLLVFITPKYYDKISDNVLKSISTRRVVVISPYGKIAKHMLKDNHPVLMLPFLKSKLKALIESASRTETTEINGKQRSRSESATLLSGKKLADEVPLQILLVEDNAVNTKVALLHLQRLGYSADSAVHGIEALSKCKERIEQKGSNYDLILMDIQMPHKDGIETSKELREIYGGTSLMPVIIALTANVETEDRDRCIACGMSDFISKPIRSDVLAKVIRNSGQAVKS